MFFTVDLRPNCFTLLHVDDLTVQSWRSRPCHCSADLPPPSTRERPPGCKTVFVGGLPENATEEIIREVFDQCGEITAIRKSKKNFCHIRFSEEFMVDKAIYLSGENTHTPVFLQNFIQFLHDFMFSSVWHWSSDGCLYICSYASNWSWSQRNQLQSKCRQTLYLCFLSSQATGCVSDPALIKRTRGGSMWTLPRPEMTCMNGSVNSACWPERKDTGARSTKSGCGRRLLLLSCTTPNTRRHC